MSTKHIKLISLCIAILLLCSISFYVFSKPRLNIASNEIRFMSIYENRINNSAQALFSELGMESHTGSYRTKHPRVYSIHGTDPNGYRVTFVFPMYPVMRRVKVEIDTARLNNESKALYTEIEYMHMLASRIGIHVNELSE